MPGQNEHVTRILVDKECSGGDDDRAVSVAERGQSKEVGGELHVHEDVRGQVQLVPTVQGPNPYSVECATICCLKRRKRWYGWLGVLHSVQYVRIRTSE